MKVVRARFPFGDRVNNTDYDYFVPVGDNPEVGDLIMTSVSMPEFEKGIDLTSVSCLFTSAPKMARIVDVFDSYGGTKATKMYLQLVSQTQIKERYDENIKFFAKRKKQNEARRKLRKMLDDQNELERYRELAAKDPKAAELLDILKDE